MLIEQYGFLLTRIAGRVHFANSYATSRDQRRGEIVANGPEHFGCRDHPRAMMQIQLDPTNRDQTIPSDRSLGTTFGRVEKART